ncbi:hypothetical protein EBI_21773 [Enterocytozoon bieneusi H348]|nr:hypothetical protein EBI_21773 [Enterocytozoon bieneusi H348]|eukprot:XP_002650730.1 hypothetical protein EBI_21773 [Enterocytozoon bieneusi H348]
MVTDVADYRAERIFSPARLIGYVGAGRHASKMHCDFIEYLVCKVRCAEDEYASHQKNPRGLFPFIPLSTIAKLQYIEHGSAGNKNRDHGKIHRERDCGAHNGDYD